MFVSAERLQYVQCTSTKQRNLESASRKDLQLFNWIVQLGDKDVIDHNEKDGDLYI